MPFGAGPLAACGGNTPKTCKPGTISADSFTCSFNLQIMLPTEEPAKLTKREPAAIIGKPEKKKKERDSSHSFKSLDASVFQLT